jgi:hypothetical protein
MNKSLQQIERHANAIWLRRLGAFIASIALATISFAPPAVTQQVYFGIADQWQDLVNHPDEWSYVRQHADGFYLNVIMLNRVIRQTATLSEATLTETCRMFSSHTAYLESDIRQPTDVLATPGGVSAELEQRYIRMLHEAGCRIIFTSLNYGWNIERAKNLTQFDLTEAEGKRLNFVQVGPWMMNGNIDGSSMLARDHNMSARSAIRASDGVSTDGPLGYWISDENNFRSASLSLVRFAHYYQKKAAIMIAPYPAGHPVGYDPKRDVLAAGQQMVRFHESQHVVPDIWNIFEYATDVAAVPEQIEGKPKDTMSGLAYWLIHHIHDPEHWMRLERGAKEADGTIGVTLTNNSTWLDLAPVLRLNVATGITAGPRLTLDGVNVTAAAMSPEGLVLTGNWELLPQMTRRFKLSMIKGALDGSIGGVTSTGLGDEDGVELTVAPGQGATHEIHDRVVISLGSASYVP